MKKTKENKTKNKKQTEKDAKNCFLKIYHKSGNYTIENIFSTTIH